MLQYCGIALCALAAVLVLKGMKSELAGLASLAAAVILLGGALAEFLPVLRQLTDSVAGTSFSGYMETLLKALGITLAVQFSAELCRDAGESAIASKLELAGKAEILLLTLPLLRELMQLAADIMQG
ncbi:MAG: stage III sporulation protein AD [Clostridia bacterium]|nr:stage III sporulation protein AD [Clostridia bacterium]